MSLSTHRRPAAALPDPARYLRPVLSRLALFCVLCATALAIAAPAGAAGRDAWSTVNLCDTARKPDWIGLRASMPGINHKGAVMLMRFQVQYLAGGKVWKQVPSLDTRYLKVGTGRTGVVSGHSFRIQPPAKGSSFVLRGLVSLRWQTAAGVVLQAKKRVTTAGHPGTVGADPAGYSAATCTIRG